MNVSKRCIGSQSGAYASWCPKEVPLQVSALLLLLDPLPRYHSGVPAGDVENFVINIVYLKLNSIYKILSAITTKYRFLANKNTKFWKFGLVIFLRFS